MDDKIQFALKLANSLATDITKILNDNYRAKATFDKLDDENTIDIRMLQGRQIVFSIFITDQGNKMYIENDPFSHCRNQPEDHKFRRIYRELVEITKSRRLVFDDGFRTDGYSAQIPFPYSALVDYYKNDLDVVVELF